MNYNFHLLFNETKYAISCHHMQTYARAKKLVNHLTIPIHSESSVKSFQEIYLTN